jgi:hypothetical protein
MRNGCTDVKNILRTSQSTKSLIFHQKNIHNIKFIEKAVLVLTIVSYLSTPFQGFFSIFFTIL